MRITLLATGTPIPEPNRQGSALLVEEGDVKLLFDAGRGVTTQLARIGIEPRQIAAHNGVKRLVLTHFRPKPEAMMQALVQEIRIDYDGDVLLGEDLMVIEI